MGNPFQGSAGSPPSTAQSLQDMASAYVNYLPSIMGVTNAQTLPAAQAALNAEMGTQPIQNTFNLQQARQFALPNAEVGQQVQNSNTQAGSATQFQNLAGAGGATGMLGELLNRAANPNYVGPQDAASRQAVNLMNSFNMNGLSPGEANAVGRSTNQGNTQTGNLGLVNPINTVSNAMNFGGAFNNKVDRLATALGSATNTAQSGLNNGMNFINTAFSQPAVPNNTVPGQFGSVAAPAGNTGIANNLLGATNATINTTIPAQAQSNFQNSPAGMFQLNSGACCFIFMEAYNGKMPWFVRLERDRYYKKYPRIVQGYKNMARWLVPKMQQDEGIRRLVETFMVKPLTWRGAWTHGLNSWGWLMEPVKQFWFLIWRIS